MAAPTPLPQRLADAFIVLLQTRLNSEQVKLIQHGDADPDDFCDANMVMADAFEDVMGRETYMPSDVEEARCTEAQADADLALWNEAVAIAQARSYGLDGIDMSASMPTAAPATADMGDALDAAAQTADLLLSDLLQANRRARAVQSLVLLPLIADARRVHDALRALIAATNEESAC